MRLSPLLLGLAALGFGWASPVLAQDGADCGFLCQLGGYLSTDHMTASPGDAAAGSGAPAKARKAHAAHRATAKPALQDAAHGAPPAAEHVAARTAPAAPVKAAATKVAAPQVAATKPGDGAPGARTAAVAKADHKADHGKAEGGKAVLAQTAVEPAARRPGPDSPKAQVAAAHPAPAPGGRTTATAKAAAKPAVVAAIVAAETPARRAPATPKPAAVQAAAAQAAAPAPDRGQARRQADRPGGSVEIASASAVPSPAATAVSARPVRTARAALPRHTPVASPAQADSPVIVLTALAAIPGSAPAISAGFQPASATAH